MPRYGDRCSCGHSKAFRDGTAICNLTDCQLPWARDYRSGVRPSWWERIAGAIAALFVGRRR